MTSLQKEVFQMVYALPEKTLTTLKPLLNELLTNAVLIKDPNANIAEMDEWDKALFLKAMNRSDLDYVSFEDALIECEVSMDEISVDF